MSAKVLRRKELDRKLALLPKKAREHIRKAIAQSAEEIVSFAKGLVPVASGDLRDSIGWTYGRAPKGSLAIAEANVGGDIRVTIFAGNQEAFYARWVEFGTQTLRAQPFFFVSYRALRKRAKSRVSRSINQSAKDVARGVT